jgi:hypothetical protein
MRKSTSILASFVSGISITTALTCAAFLTGNRALSGALLWPVTLIVYLMGPGPLLGYNAEGQPTYEGTPLHLIALPVGLFLEAVIYSVIVYCALRYTPSGLFVLRRTDGRKKAR